MKDDHSHKRSLNGERDRGGSDAPKNSAGKPEGENAKFEILSRAINDAIWDWNLADDSMVWNHGLFTIYGYDSEKAPHNAEEWKANIHADDKDEILISLRETFSAGRNNWNGIYRYRCLNGSYKYTYDRGYVLYEGSKPVRMIGAMQDIDERMVALREIEKLSLVASNTDNLVVITGPGEKIEWVNQAFIKRTGYPLHEVIGQTPRFLQGPDTDRSALDRIRKGIAEQVSVTEEILNYTRDGSRFWLRININPVFDANQKLVKFVAVETDITLQKEYEKKITTIARDLTNLIETANAPIFGIDRDGRVNELNHLAEGITGFKKSELIGHPFIDRLVHANYQEEIAARIREVYAGKPFSNLEVPFTKKDSQQIVVLMNATARKNTNDEIESLFLVGQDITEITQYRQSLEERVRERTEELQAALKKEKELVTIKSRFASIVSHEFRTPLSTISVSANHIKKFRSRLQPADIDKKLDVIQEQVSHMTQLLEDVLTIGKNESGKIALTKRKINIQELILNIRDDVSNQFKNTHTIHCNLNVHNHYIISDDGLLRNIFVNLLSNAIKFSPENKNIYIDAVEDESCQEFNIRDEGIGIPAADKDRIFSPFDRGTNATKIPGTGLGLSIVKKAIDLIGGTINLTSEPGKGTVFSVRIPLR